LKVLFIARPNLFTSRGGDTVQIESTALSLQKLGVEVRLFDHKKDSKVERYDLIHYFNLIDPEDILGHLDRFKEPKLLSTIYLKYDEYDKKHRGGFIGLLSQFVSYETVEYFKTVAKFLIKGERLSSYRYLLLGHKGSMKRVLSKVDHLLPNSFSELTRVQNDFKIDLPYTVVTNAFDRLTYLPHTVAKEDFVLCVARFEGNKNQINLIKAANKFGFKLILVGKASPNQAAYLDNCKKIANSNVEFLGYVTQEDLCDLYAKAKVHVLPSWFETTGLSSLEAAAMGCNIVVSDKGDVREYFGDLAYYCEPDDLDSIAAAVEVALRSPVNKALQEKVLNEYNWERAAEQTLSAYKKVLGND
jgi:glycosyltransferase involved in cell wall biosynthesis